MRVTVRRRTTIRNCVGTAILPFFFVGAPGFPPHPHPPNPGHTLIKARTLALPLPCVSLSLARWLGPSPLHSMLHSRAAPTPLRCAVPQLLLIVTSPPCFRIRLDYPNVTAVIQFGSPATRYTYIHRLGRTARGGNEYGSGHLLLAPFEKPFLQCIADLPLQFPAQDTPPPQALPRPRASDPAQVEQATKAWEEWVIFQGMRPLLCLTTHDLLQCATSYALCLGLPACPPLDHYLARRIGLHEQAPEMEETV